MGDKASSLYVILLAATIHPSKGKLVMQLNMRRILDAVKESERYRTTQQVERTDVVDREHTLLYHDGELNHFMKPKMLRAGGGVAGCNRRRGAFSAGRHGGDAVAAQRGLASPFSCRGEACWR